MQFYLLLPLIAAGIALFVGTTGSVLRLGSAVLVVMLAGLSVRGAFAFRDSWLPLLPGVLRAGANLLLPLTFGTVGKFLEVFALGMLCSVLYLYVAHHELRRLAALRARLLSPILLICGLSVYLMIAYAPGVQLLLQAAVVDLHGSQQFLLAATGFEFSVGSAYSLILLSILWSRGLLRAIFEWAPLRFVGLVSVQPLSVASANHALGAEHAAQERHVGQCAASHAARRRLGRRHTRRVPLVSTRGAAVPQAAQPPPQ
jgi:membrane protein CcdC involved in cytochrome C biogenesis